MFGGVIQSTIGALTSHSLRGGMRSLHNTSLGSTNLRALTAGTGTGTMDIRALLEAGDEYGSSVSISGDTAGIGSPYDDTTGSDSGAVYVIKWSGVDLITQAKLLASDGSEDDSSVFLSLVIL